MRKRLLLIHSVVEIYLVPSLQSNGTVLRRHFWINNLFRFLDPSANSIRHAGYVDIRRRVGRGLTFTANYVW